MRGGYFMLTTISRSQSSLKSSTFSPSSRFAKGHLLQRKCACGCSVDMTEERAECRRKQLVLQPPLIQSNLAISKPGDRLEREADQVADAVVSMPEPKINKAKTTDYDKQNSSDDISSEVESRINPPGNGGRPLPESTRAFFEPRFGHDFSRVRVHMDEPAASLAQAVNARAFTVGHNIVFGAGQFSPAAQTGQWLLAHELSHVVQKAPGIARDNGIITAPEIDIRGLLGERAFESPPPLRGRHPRVPPLAGWRVRVLQAMGEGNRRRQARAYLQLINEAVTPDSQHYPELTLPVENFRSNAAARHGHVYFDSSIPSQPGQIGTRAFTETAPGLGAARPKVFIVMAAGSLHADDGPAFTRRALNHEYVHFLQISQERLTNRPSCRGVWRGEPIGGNPNREVEAVTTTFVRFFPEWADAAQPGKTDSPHYLFEDLALLQAYFPCATRQIQGEGIARIVTAVRGKPARLQHLQRLIQDVRSSTLPNVTLDRFDNAMERLADAVGASLPRDPRLPPFPGRARSPLFDPRRFQRRSFEQSRRRILESVP